MPDVTATAENFETSGMAAFSIAKRAVLSYKLGAIPACVQTYMHCCYVDLARVLGCCQRCGTMAVLSRKKGTIEINDPAQKRRLRWDSCSSEQRQFGSAQVHVKEKARTYRDPDEFETVRDPISYCLHSIDRKETLAQRDLHVGKRIGRASGLPVTRLSLPSILP